MVNCLENFPFLLVVLFGLDRFVSCDLEVLFCFVDLLCLFDFLCLESLVFEPRLLAWFEDFLEEDLENPLRPPDI